jgi:hypothetical protein
VNSMGDQLKQQMQSSEEKKMSAPATETAAIDAKLAEELKRVNADTEEFEDEVSSTVLENDAAFSILTSAFSKDNAIRVKMQTKLLVNLTAEESSLPDVVKGGNGFYSVRSPLRKSKDGPLGSARDPSGLVRDSLTSVIEYLATANSEKVVFFGSAASVNDNITQMMRYYQNGINEILYRPFGGATTVKIEQGEGDDEQVEDETLNSAFFTDNWVAFKQVDNDLLVFPVFAINLRVPLLVNADNQYKAIVNMSRALHAIGERFGLIDSLIVAYGMDSESLATPQSLGVLNGFNEAQHPVFLVSVGSVARMLEGGEDPLGIYPDATCLEDACAKLFPFSEFPFGRDMLLIV